MFLVVFAQEAADTLPVDMSLLNLLAGFVVPLLVGFVTKLNAPSGLKAVLNLLLSAVAGALTTAIAADGNIELAEWITGIGLTWITSLATYAGFWKPSGVAPAIQEKTANVGVGGTATHARAA